MERRFLAAALTGHPRLNFQQWRPRWATSPRSSEAPGDPDSGVGQSSEVSPGAPTSRRDLSQCSASVWSYPATHELSSGLRPPTSTRGLQPRPNPRRWRRPWGPWYVFSPTSVSSGFHLFVSCWDSNPFSAWPGSRFLPFIFFTQFAVRFRWTSISSCSLLARSYDVSRDTPTLVRFVSFRARNSLYLVPASKGGSLQRWLSGVFSLKLTDAPNYL
jgi:hypothetical protein